MYMDVRIDSPAGARDRQTLSGLVENLLEMGRSRIDIWRATRALHRMSDRDLKDIGVARCGIDYVVRCGIN